ncbi:MAG: bifunctional molybdenum cofactor biosynthesis protein MoaC/MoaB [Bacteroidetes bacterium]|nr:bifunctional molybdenum cofactor biosynthesis protein MoaC/MoaB [Bacteroidota bacterium]
MNNITQKIYTHRSAIASAIVEVSIEETIQLINNNSVPKGNIFEMSKAAALLAIKNTSNVIPDCHPLPVEFASVSSQLIGLEIHIHVEVQTIYKTGVEVEAMHGAAIAALTMYDMLKPVDKQVSIKNIHLAEKSGGKSQYKDILTTDINAAVIVCSDSVAAGKKEDRAGKAVMKKLESLPVQISVYEIIPDEPEIIKQKITDLLAQNIQLILISGGTGLSKRDITPEVIQPMLEREIPGIMEAARSYGQQRMPYAMLSRGVAGMIGDSVVITLPGSTRGTEETMDALFPYVLHIFKVAKGVRHD